MNEQQKFWALDYANEYVKKNNSFDEHKGVEAWSSMLSKTENIKTVLECGSNIGRNINFIGKAFPMIEKSIIEISDQAYDFVNSHYEISKSFNGSIIDSNFQNNSFDLVFSMGVLIHIHPDDLLLNMKKMWTYSKKYILIGEYFSRKPEMIEYQGQLNKLFKCDFGSLFIDNFDVSIVDYGFLWGYEYDKAGFDDITWWLFEKNGV